MDLLFVTCSGANQHTNIEDLANLLKAYPLAEIGVQVSERQCPNYGDRLQWIYALHAYLCAKKQRINAALHVNLTWVEDFGQGVVVPIMQDLLRLDDFEGNPFFQRVQLNFRIGRERRPDEDKMAALIKQYNRHRFILSYNASNDVFIHTLYKRGVKFDLLYDDSFGQGFIPDSRRPPVFGDIVQGYSGGISPENVTTVLDEIAASCKYFTSAAGVYIDAQRRLEDDNTHMDLGKCADYLRKAVVWKRENACD